MGTENAPRGRVSNTEHEHILLVISVVHRGRLHDGRNGVIIRDQHGMTHELPEELADGITTADIRIGTKLKGSFMRQVSIELKSFMPELREGKAAA